MQKFTYTPYYDISSVAILNPRMKDILCGLGGSLSVAPGQENDK